LEAFVELFRLWPDPVLRRRIEELIELIAVRWWIEPGRISGDAWLDNEPIPGKHSYGHDLSITHLLLDAADVLGRPEDPWLRGRAEALLQTALADSWDDGAGGFFDRQVGPGAVPGPAKIWWVQAEGLACLAALSDAGGGRCELLERQWRWIAERQIDPVHGGWFETIGPDGHPIGDLSKGKPWKEIYHEVRAALVLAKGLGAPPEAILRRD
jgi:cellobiose epimerase